MAMIDDRGRVAGRINLVDMAAAITVLLVLPAAFGAFMLFRSPPPKLAAITPNRLYEGNQVKVEITGRDLRPFMRVSFNDVQGKSFLINTPKSVLVDLPELASGVYDVVLYDYRQEVDRLPKAFTIMPRPFQPTIALELEGAFVGLNDALAAEMVPGAKFPPSAAEPAAEILSIAPAGPGRMQLRIGTATLSMPSSEAQVPATIRARCVIIGNPDGTLSCSSAGTEQSVVIAPDAALTLPGQHGWVRYQIHAVHAPSAAAGVMDARVRFVGEPELIALLKAGDVDAGPYASATSRHATLTVVSAPRALAPGEVMGAGSGVGASRAVDTTVRVPLDRAGSEWTYINRVLKVGAPFTFETTRYVVRGEVVGMTSVTAAAPEKH
jgi:hypothetical protein